MVKKVNFWEKNVWNRQKCVRCKVWGVGRQKSLNLNLKGWKWTKMGNQGKGRTNCLNLN